MAISTRGMEVEGVRFVLSGLNKWGRAPFVAMIPRYVVWPEIGADPANLVQFYVNCELWGCSDESPPLFRVATTGECRIGQLEEFLKAAEFVHANLTGSARLNCDDGAFELRISVMERGHGRLKVSGKVSNSYTDWRSADVKGDGTEGPKGSLEFTLVVEQTFVTPFISELSRFLEAVANMRIVGPKK